MPKYNAKTTENYFAFLSPFEATVWFTIAVSVIFTSLVLAICVNLTPTNFNNKRKERRKSIEKRWRFFLDHFSTSTLVELLVACSSWNRIGTKKQSSSKNCNADMVVNYGYSYCCIYSKISSIYDSPEYETSHYEIHKIAYKMMKKHNTLINDSFVGIERVRASYYLPEGHKNRFAFIYDSPVLDYTAMQKPCNVERVGRLFGLQNYGLGLPKGSPFEKQFTSSILKLREEGYMDFLNKQWFTNNCPGNI
ncbi:glutamate receptor ionotropic, kainate 5-like [Centruroides vittatus]|uniref:glutamate receptor ionotropic, kainate 5-like n=1 Tax=Centruroides vittatus TaxID=120091 RepID=UPI003510ABC3